MKRALVASVIFLLADAMLGVGQTSEPSFFPLDQVRPGLRGIGKTVFEGRKIEEFEVEILGVLPGKPGPKQSIIIARLGGPQIERTGVFAGMSGSPVYLDGKLLGAIAYAFPFSREPIAGITPIQDMLGVLREKSAVVSPADTRSRSETRRVSVLRSDGFGTGLASLLDVKSDAISLDGEPIGLLPSASLRGYSLLPIATPLAASGIPLDALEKFLPDLRQVGLLPVSGLTAGARIAPLHPATERTLEPGSAVSIQLVRGDFTLEAIGTVTCRLGDKVYAFGHRLFNLGAIEMPMSSASTITIVPSTMNSFKLGVTEDLVGVLKEDRSAGVLGKLGVAPQMIPVTITQRTSRGTTETYRFEMVHNNVLTPVLTNLTVFSAITNSERSFGDATLRLRGRIQVTGEEDVILDHRFSALNEAPVQASLAVALPVSYLLGSGFENVTIKGIELEIEAMETRRVGVVDRVWVNRTDVRRGESVEVQVYARTGDGREIVERVPVEIPEDAPLGKLSVVVGDGSSIQAYDGRPPLLALGSVQNLGQLIRALNRLRKSDRLYLKIVRATTGAVVNNEELPLLPPSVLATMGSDRTAGGYQPVQYATLKEIEIPAGDYILAGQRQVTITVVR